MTIVENTHLQQITADEMDNNSVISIDLAKNVFLVYVLNLHNKITTNKKVRRSRLLETVLNLDGKRIVMEACYSSNYWGRLFQQHGFHVDLTPAYSGEAEHPFRRKMNTSQP
jgi:transposase